MSQQTISPASITWQQQQPFSRRYNDIYFSPDGAGEVERVFLAPCGLSDPPNLSTLDCLTVAELGFGTGLNFAVLAQRLFLDDRAHSSQRLHFISFEAHPLTFGDWQKVAGAQPSLSIYKNLAKYPPPLITGWHRRVFAEGRITLSVFHGDATVGLSDLCERSTTPVDAWFLDGFAPDRNPQLWSPALFERIAKTCRQGSRVATFTAAGQVRRDLTSLGFDMRRVDQRPFKRESLSGTFVKKNRQPTTAPSGVTVYGAGIAGAMVAHHIANQGIDTLVVDPGGIAAGASAMHHTLLHARLLGDNSHTANLRAHAFHYATAYVEQFMNKPPSGVLQIQGPNLDEAKLRRIAACYGADGGADGGADEGTNHGGVNHHWIELQSNDPNQLGLDGPALWFPTSRHIDLAALCAKLLAHPKIELRTEPPTTESHRVVCAASQSRSFAGCAAFELVDVGGQLDRLRFTPTRAQIPIVGKGYYLPLADGAVVGSTYEHADWAMDDATQHNVAQNQKYLPTTFQWHSRQRAYRCVASDRLPIIGATDQRTWVATGMGSMGTTFSPLAAAMVQSELLGWLPPVSPQLSTLVEPGRFVRRQARRGIRHR